MDEMTIGYALRGIAWSNGLKEVTKEQLIQMMFELGYLYDLENYHIRRIEKWMNM